MTKPPKTNTAVAEPYQPTEREREIMATVTDKLHARAPSVKVLRAGEDAVTLGTDHPDHVTGATLLAAALGTGSLMFAQAFVETLIQATSIKGQIQEAPLNRAIDIVTALQPEDEAVAMLAAQMAMVHRAAMHAARRMENSDTLLQLEAHDRCLNRLTRTYAAQMDTLKRYRSRGQKVIVEHVHVYEGGQAIVGDVRHGGGGAPSKPKATA